MSMLIIAMECWSCLLTLLPTKGNGVTTLGSSDFLFVICATNYVPISRSVPMEYGGRKYLLPTILPIIEAFFKPPYFFSHGCNFIIIPTVCELSGP